jgi:hypothetical protein
MHIWVSPNSFSGLSGSELGMEDALIVPVPKIERLCFVSLIPAIAKTGTRIQNTKDKI